MAKAQTTKKDGKAAPKAATKAAPEKPKTAAKGNALQTPLKASEDLASIVGSTTVTRPEVVKKMWDYIKLHKLQNPENKREILADDKLKKVFGKSKVTMFEMNKLLSAHLS